MDVHDAWCWRVPVAVMVMAMVVMTVMVVMAVVAVVMVVLVATVARQASKLIFLTTGSSTVINTNLLRFVSRIATSTLFHSSARHSVRDAATTSGSPRYARERFEKLAA